MKLSLLLVLFPLTCSSELLGASHRYDYITDQTLYPETCCKNKGGGRLNLILSADSSYKFNGSLAAAYPLEVSLMAGKSITTVKLAGSGDASFDDTTGQLDWLHADTEGNSGRVWVSLHAHSDDYIESLTEINVTDNHGVLVASESKMSVSSKTPNLRISYVTTMDSFATTVVHIHNYDGDDEIHVSSSIAREYRMHNASFSSSSSSSSTYKISSLSIDGVDIPEAAGVSIEGGGHRVFTVAASSGAERGEGSVWTGLLVSDEGTFGAGGRLIKETFILNDWPKSDQCPFFGADEDKRATLAEDMSLNSRFLKKGGTCDASTTEVLDATVAAGDKGELLLLDRDLSDSDSSKFIDGIDTKYSAKIAALSIGDEVDDDYGDKVLTVWRDAVARRLAYPGLSTYQGGHVASFNGAYAGMTDVQGMDFYVAACAPHVTNYASTMRIQGAYDYLHMTVRRESRALRNSLVLLILSKFSLRSLFPCAHV
jgi:hypothetical protein